MTVWKDNPGWLAKALAENLDRLMVEIPQPWMPKISDAEALEEDVVVSFDELGCGAYGCVLPTHDAGVVLKITTDRTEVEFVTMAGPWGWPAGITKYYGQIPLVGEYKLHRQLPAGPAWALWREEASQIGDLDILEPLSIDGEIESDFDFAARMEAALPLEILKNVGNRIYTLFVSARDPFGLFRAAHAKKAEATEMLARSGIGDRVMKEAAKRGAVVDLAVALEAYHQIVAGLVQQETMRSVGEALVFYAGRQLLLTDLHLGNFGLVNRREGEHAEAGSRSVWAITDPGHVVALPMVW